MTEWNSINPNQLLPSSLTSAVSAIAQTIEGALSAAEDALTLPTLPTLPTPPSVPAAVINAILDTLQAILRAGRTHTLIVPISKQIPQAPPPVLPATLDDLQASLAVSLGPTDTTAHDAYAKLVNRRGGNAGFYNAFAMSLMDPADPNRPQYDSGKDAVFMAVLLVGAPNFSAIVPATTLLDRLTSPKAGNSTGARVVPTPQNVRGRVAGSSSAPNVGVRLDWDVPKAAYSSIYFPGVSMVINRYAVIRSTDPKAMSARSVLDLFSTQALTEGMTSGKNTVVSIGHGLGSAYFDDAKLDPTVPVYYCVTWEMAATESSGTSTLQFDKISNVAKVTVQAPQPPQTGVSPDWIATASPIEAFPPLANALQSLIEQTRVLITPSSDSTGRLNDAIQLAQDTSKRLSSRAAELLSDVKQLAVELASPIPSLYVTQMSSETGGNTFLMSELAKRLNDPSDSSRPPFDNGEYVCGVCFVAGAPRLADLAAIISFFAALFGPADATNPLMGILTAIDTAVTATETAVFGVDMQPLPPGTVVDPVTGQPPAPATPVTANDGTPVGTADPANPDAGFTNVLPTSELC